MPKALYKYYLKVPDGEFFDYYEVTSVEKHTLKYERDNNQYKITSSAIKLEGADYDLLKSFGKYSEIYFQVRKSATDGSSSQDVVFDGKITWKKDNEREKVAQIEAKQIDSQLDVILNNANTSQNIFSSQIFIEYLIKNTSKNISSIDGFTKFASAISYSGETYDVFMCYRSRFGIAYPTYTPETEYEYDSAFIAYPYPSSFGAPTFSVSESAEPSPPSGFLLVRAYESDIEIDFPNGPPFTYTYVEDETLDYLAITGRKTIYEKEGEPFGLATARNGIVLREVIRYALSRIPFDYDVKSSFLFGDDTESYSSWTPSAVGDFDPTILQLVSASDLKNPYADQPATKAEITLNSILATLTTMQCFWFIDENGKFRIEHVSYKREEGNTLDLRTVYGQNNIPICEPLQVTEESDEGSEGKVEISTYQSFSSAFNSKSIFYTSAGANLENSRQVQADGLSFDYVAAPDSDNIPSETILLIDNGVIGVEGFRALPTLETQNIIEKLWRHEAAWPTFVIDNGTTQYNAETLSYAVSVEEINMPNQDAPFSPDVLFKTFYADGNKLAVCESAEIDTYTGNIILNLKFERE